MVAGLVVGVAIGAAAAVVLLLLGPAVAQVLLARPWDPTFRTYDIFHKSPTLLFWQASWYHRIVELFAQSKPAPMRVAEVSMIYIQSQVLFALVDLRIPELLIGGAKSAQQLAAEIGPQVQADWLERVLAAAHAYGLLSRVAAPRQLHAQPPAPRQVAADAGSPTCDLEIGADGTDTLPVKDQGATPQHHSSAAKARQPAAAAAAVSSAASLSPYHYKLNATSSVLCDSHPASMANFARMMRNHFRPFSYLAQGVRSGVTPFEVMTGGQSFWDYLSDHPDQTAEFDGAMTQVNELGGHAVLRAYNWRGLAAVVDVAGGAGGFAATMLKANPQLRTWVLDRQVQVERGQQVWERNHQDLLSRHTFIAGDMFDPATIPSPSTLQLAAPRPSIAYTLRNILHDWSDADSLAILKAIRARISAADVASGLVKLLILEYTTCEAPCKSVIAHRRAADMIMLMSFGDGQERSREQFESLLTAAGWRLARVLPTCSVMLVLEAVPI